MPANPCALAQSRHIRENVAGWNGSPIGYQMAPILTPVVSFTIDAPPPTRHDPGRCADRSSPNALPLFRAVASYVSTHREDLPIRHPVKVLIASPEPFREPDGYTIATSIEEVLVDAGFLADERLVEMEAHEARPEMATGYSVQIEPSF
jgi:hypothetical protein